MLKSEGKSLRVYETNEDELNEELREKLYAEFREGNEDLAVGESGEVMFEVTADEYQTRTSKRDGKKKRVIFVATKDGTRFEQVLDVQKHFLDVVFFGRPSKKSLDVQQKTWTSNKMFWTSTFFLDVQQLFLT